MEPDLKAIIRKRIDSGESFTKIRNDLIKQGFLEQDIDKIIAIFDWRRELENDPQLKNEILYAPTTEERNRQKTIVGFISFLGAVLYVTIDYLVKTHWRLDVFSIGLFIVFLLIGIAASLMFNIPLQLL